MSHSPTSGLLPALIGYYRRLQEDPDSGVADQGFSVEKIHFAVILEPDGTLADFVDIRERSDKGKPIPTAMQVPDGGGRQGIGLKPFFCWDNTGYVLGRDNKGKPERAAEQFAAFREAHLSFLPELESDPGFVAMTRFLQSWDPSRAESLTHWEEAAGMNVVFRLRGRQEYVHQNASVKEVWLRRSSTPDPGEKSLRGFSLVDGQETEVARLHPQIRGVVGANTTGAAIVSFNLNAFESYGKSQSYNAPVGVHDAFRYTTALNRLLADDSRRIRIGDATVTFWTDRADAADFEDWFGDSVGDNSFFKETKPEDSKTRDRVRIFLEAARRGALSELLKDTDAPFYVLGLSPNASRLNIRYWIMGTVSQFADRLVRHLAELELEGAPPNSPPHTIPRLLRETAREAKDIPEQLAGEVTRSVLAGTPYPKSLLISIVRRVRADSTVNHRRASILKACLVRNLKESVPVALNKDHPADAYQLGRLFAVLEKIQEEASNSSLNSTIKDRFFGAAAATPALVFPRLLQLSNHHLRKIERAGVRKYCERLADEIMGRFSGFPPRLTLEAQGLFYIGYFHQRTDFFPKHAEPTEENSNV